VSGIARLHRPESSLDK
jgi:putative transposase